MESQKVSSNAYCPIMKGIFKHLRDRDAIIRYFVYKGFRYFTKERIHLISSEKQCYITRLINPNNKKYWGLIKDFND